MGCCVQTVCTWHTSVYGISKKPRRQRWGIGRLQVEEEKQKVTTPIYLRAGLPL
jgi:hypothetical protein